MIDLHAIRASDLMSPELVGIPPSATLQQAAELMSERRIHCLLVDLDAPGRGLGIIAGKDIVQLLGEVEPRALEEIAVSDVMSCPAVSVPHDLCIRDCINLMLMSGVRRVVVLRDSDPIGLLSYTDVMDAIAGNRTV